MYWIFFYSKCIFLGNKIIYKFPYTNTHTHKIIANELSKMFNDMDYCSNMWIIMHARHMISHSSMSNHRREDSWKAHFLQTKKWFIRLVNYFNYSFIYWFVYVYVFVFVHGYFSVFSNAIRRKNVVTCVVFE